MDYRLRPNDILVLLGGHADLDRAVQLLTAPTLDEEEHLVLCLTNRFTNLLVFFAVGCVRHPGLDPGSSSRGARH